LTTRAFAAPNLVIMMTDDQRFDALSCAGNKILKTPHIDRLATEGMRFRNMFVTNSLCAPSRATLLTGLYSHSHGVIDNKNRSLDAKQKLVSDYLREAGYATAFCGKSHIGGFLRDREWDYYFGYRGQGNYLKPMIAEGTKGKDQAYDGYMDDVVTDHAVAWLKQQKDKPFCLFLFFKAPHRSWDRAPRHKDLFKDDMIPKPATWDAKLDDKPKAVQEAKNRVGQFADVKTLDGFVKDYYATIVAVDENVGKVYDALKEMGKLDDTMMLFTSDNGFFHGEFQMFDKRLMYEPSIRVPLLIRYPKLAKAGTVRDEMVLNVDFTPTLLDLAGVPLPKGLHGRSLKPLLAGEKPAWRKDWLYEYFEDPDPSHNCRKHRGVRTERYKYIHYFGTPEEFELYDLEKDPDERHNLYGKPEVAEITVTLRKRLEELRQETGDR
jgi:arylsulfatase A-like enzyme